LSTGEQLAVCEQIEQALVGQLGVQDKLMTAATENGVNPGDKGS